MIALRYYEPPSDLIEMVGSIYLFTANMPHVSDHVRADFAQLRFNLSGRGHYIFCDGRQMESPQTCILGATMWSAPFEVEGPLQTVGVPLMPLGWLELKGLDAREYVTSLFIAAYIYPEFPVLEKQVLTIQLLQR